MRTSNLWCQGNSGEEMGRAKDLGGSGDKLRKCLFDGFYS